MDDLDWLDDDWSDEEDGLSPSQELIAWFQSEAERLLPPALRSIQELCEMGDTEDVRLKAAACVLVFADKCSSGRRSRTGQAEQVPPWAAVT